MFFAFFSNVKLILRNARGKIWGSDEINVEGWKPLKRLQGHESGLSMPPQASESKLQLLTFR
ncbi:hypothetical protein BDZ97DRAFT_1662888 [Flammula alnicola]|nr:hypothetical protein BDZ97DRAFT_1675253 [Flammula alnicola]KAF8962418.1 hypothetical protein BDZ97DRAFT_1662888 [Flammula alnicola]